MTYKLVVWQSWRPPSLPHQSGHVLVKDQREPRCRQLGEYVLLRCRITGIHRHIRSRPDDGDDDRRYTQDRQAGPGDGIVDIGRGEVVCEQWPEVPVCVKAESEEEEEVDVNNELTTKWGCRTQSED